MLVDRKFCRAYFLGLEDTAHVLDVKGTIYNAVLGMVDITRGTNSYYKLQVLKEDNSSRFGMMFSFSFESLFEL